MSSISRRDFLNGAALTIAAGLTPAAQIAAQPVRYPPALTGLRGQHPGSFEAAHAQAYERGRFPLDGAPIEERYDLVVVGGGISGLAAAWFYRRAAGPSARILILDNHDDFGGHAKRNEFTLDGRLVHRLRRQRVDQFAADALQRRGEGAAARTRRRDRAVRDAPSIASSIRRSASPAACSFRAKPSAATCWCRASPRREEPTSSRAPWPTPSRLREFIAAFPIAPESKAQLRRAL